MELLLHFPLTCRGFVYAVSSLPVPFFHGLAPPAFDSPWQTRGLHEEALHCCPHEGRPASVYLTYAREARPPPCLSSSWAPR